MHIKFLDHGKGSGRAAVTYLLGTHDHNGEKRAEVRVLRGDPELVGQIADSLDFVHRYTSGAINWSLTDNPSDEQIDQVLDDFERVAFAGLDPSRVAHCAVLHVDQDGSRHVHVLTARVDLMTGKSLNVAPPGWKKSYDPLRDYYNHAHGWARPDDPLRARALRPGKRALIEASTMRRARARNSDLAALDDDALRRALEIEPDPRAVITDDLMKRIDAGQIENRDGILAALRKSGFEIPRAGRDYITVLNPKTGSRYRLKGRIYEASWTAASERVTNMLKSAAAAPRPDPEAAEKARVDLEAAIERRAKYNRERYPAPPAPAPAPVPVARKRTPKPDEVAVDDRSRNVAARLAEEIDRGIRRARAAIDRGLRESREALESGIRRARAALFEELEGLNGNLRRVRNSVVGSGEQQEVDLDAAMNRKPGSGPSGPRM